MQCVGWIRFKGYLQTDGYAGYEQYGKQAGGTHLCCWAHARREFFGVRANVGHVLNWHWSLSENSIRSKPMYFQMRYLVGLTL